MMAGAQADQKDKTFDENRSTWKEISFITLKYNINDNK